MLSFKGKRFDSVTRLGSPETIASVRTASSAPGLRRGSPFVFTHSDYSALITLGCDVMAPFVESDARTKARIAVR